MIGIEGNTNDGDFGLQGNVLNAQKAKGNDHCTYWLEYDIGTTSLTLYGGNADTNEKTEYATVKNAFTLSGADNYYMNFGYDNSYEIDNVKVYSVNAETTKTYLDCGFDSNDDYMIGGSGAEADRHKLVLVDSGKVSSLKTYDTLIKVTNPAEDARITTVNKLAVDTKLDVTFELNAAYRLNAMIARSVSLSDLKVTERRSRPPQKAQVSYISRRTPTARSFSALKISTKTVLLRRLRNTLLQTKPKLRISNLA